MAAFLTVVVGREGRSILFGDVTGFAIAVVIAALVVMPAAWLFFWFRLAGGPDRLGNGLTFLVVLGACLALIVASPLSGVYPMYYAAVMAGAVFRWRIGVALVVAVAAITTFAWPAAGGAWSLQVPVIVTLLGGSSVIVRRYVSAHMELQTARDALRRLAGAEARADLARDLHDRVGQQLSAVILQGELLRMEISGTADATVQECAATVVATARDALQAMREVVAGEREPRLATESDVARQLLEASGIGCSVELSKDDLPLAVDRILAWVVREGTSNVLRHSGASRCSIAVHLEPTFVAVDLTDDGCARNGATRGNGLHGLEERLREAGGTLEVTTVDPHGLRLRATVPTQVPA
ncbi:MAG: hypothetical protein JF887_14155 [Candidatus Dormibacteraeota bacterium]|uniref:Signal transduction histidine kinase subgroup 3 dimerisation and phosphoacceptor domain-containing protein n=1 Tax=Candidatus Amunia macphersoniae TaxID=3127014 RepID=A0A934KQC4_9BACT|nr:hypothetical protein [Candidatus Dormibacteraeota bacterium]